MNEKSSSLYRYYISMRRSYDNVKRWIHHDVAIYFIRLRKALRGESFTPKCCYSFSLDCSIMKTFSENFEYLISKRGELFVISAKETEDMKELLKLTSTYSDRVFNLKPRTVQKKIKKMFGLMEKYFTKFCY